MRIVGVGNFGLRTKGTMVARALPLFAELARQGEEVTLVLPPWDSPEDAGQAERRDGVRILYTTLPPMLPIIGHFLLGLLVCLRAFRQRPDVLYAFKPKAYAGFTLGAFLLLRGLGFYQGKVVLDTDDWEGDGGWNDRERDRFNPFWRRFISWHERWCLRSADLVTCASIALEEKSTMLGTQRPVHYLPIGTKVAGIASPAASAPLPLTSMLQGKKVVLAYTRLAEYSPRRLAATFSLIAERLPEARLLVVGRGLRGEERELEAALGELGLSDKSALVGWVEPESIPGYFRLADVAIHLLDDTLLNRTKGLAKLIELLAAGVAVVCDDVGQARAYIDRGETGLLVVPENPEAMAEAVISLLQNPERARRIGEAARRSTTELWNWERIAAGFRRILREESNR